jgi:hypothetical protein
MDGLPDDAELLALPAEERIDLLAALERQRRRFEAAQLRLLATFETGEHSEWGLEQEAISLVLQLPVRTAQTRLAQAATLVRQLPRTLNAVAEGAISGGHANVLAEAVWRLPADPGLPAALEEAVLPPVLATGCVTCLSCGGGSAARYSPWTLRPPSSGTNGRWPTGGWNTTPVRTAWPASPHCSRHQKRS